MTAHALVDDPCREPTETERDDTLRWYREVVEPLYDDGAHRPGGDA